MVLVWIDESCLSSASTKIESSRCSTRLTKLRLQPGYITDSEECTRDAYANIGEHGKMLAPSRFSCILSKLQKHVQT